MKKSLIFACIFMFVSLALMSSFAAAANDSNFSSSQGAGSNAFLKTDIDSDASVEKGYQCLNDQIVNKSRFSLEEASFITLAVGSKDNVLKVITDSKSASHCWPKTGCTLKDTARVAMAYNKIGKGTEDVEKWLSSRNASTTELGWYLEIDTEEKSAAECTIRYDNRSYKASIHDDMTVTGALGSCLSAQGYWPRISNNCLDKAFEVSCNKDFITTLLYKKNTGDTIFVSYDTHSAPSLGTTQEKVKSKCFKTGTGCDYEGSLWAALAMQKLGNDVSDYIPYLSALAEDNKQYFPEAFLYILNGGDDFYNQIVQSQKRGQYWQVGGTSQNFVFYDTSLAMLALSSSSAAELGNAKNYLFNIQGKNGCWNNNNLRDTAFILYSGWPKDGAVSGNIGGKTTLLCEPGKGYCANRDACLNSAGSVFSGYECTTKFSDVCCSVNAQLISCSEKTSGKGKICGASEQCSGTSEAALDGTCCLEGSCIPVEQQTACESDGGICRSFCDSGTEETGTASCGDSIKICCLSKKVNESSFGTILLILLIILIALAVLAIIYRDNLRLWWFKFRGRAGSSPASRPSGPPGPEGQGMRRQLQSSRPSFPMMQRAQARPRSRDSELDETLRKLKEMSQ